MRAFFARPGWRSAGSRCGAFGRLPQLCRRAVFLAAGLIWLSPALATDTVTYSYDARGRLITVAHSGTAPNAGIASSYSYDKADNRTQLVVSPSLTLSLSPTTLPGGTLGAAYSNTITASGGSGGYSYQNTAGTLPAGLALNSTTGLLSGTPSNAATYSFTVTATDSSANTGSRAYSVTINAPGQLTLTPATLPGGTVGTSYRQTINATGGSGSGEQYVVSAGVLPPGLALRKLTGVLTGTPTTSGNYNFTVTATDSANNSGSRAYSVVIGGSGGIVAFSISDASASEGSPLVFTVTRSGSTTGTSSVNFATADGTATSTDYTPTSGTLTFASGVTSQTVRVSTTTDVRVESDETMYVNLTGATTGSTITDNQGVGTIFNVDSGGSCGGPVPSC